MLLLAPFGRSGATSIHEFLMIYFDTVSKIEAMYGRSLVSILFTHVKVTQQ